jgi:hypothetical protein
MSRETPLSQAETYSISIYQILRHPQFVKGLCDIRTGRPFDAELAEDGWFYERGRLFGCIAPLSMPLKLNDDSLNPQAVELFAAAMKRGLIL